MQHYSAPRFELGRRAVAMALVAAALAAPRRALALVLGDAPTDPLAAFGPWLDTLIPADETPGATALGVRAAILDQARGQGGAVAFLQSACGWLDGEARKRGATGFAALDDGAREAIAAAASAAPKGTLPRLLFDNSWRLATFHYYARPEVWASLDFAGPPQPVGFPDADRPP